MHPSKSAPIAQHIQAPRSEAISLSGVRNRPFLRERNWGWQVLLIGCGRSRPIVIMNRHAILVRVIHHSKVTIIC